MRIFLKIIILTSCLFFVGDLHSRKVKQTLRIEKSPGADKKKASQKKETDNIIEVQVSSQDTIRVSEAENAPFVVSEVTFAGYDKSVNARKESVHVVNHSRYEITCCKFRIIYYDMKGRMLHRRDATIRCVIPPGETRKADFPTWDTQNSFFYHLGNNPRKIASAYKVDITPLSFSLRIYE